MRPRSSSVALLGLLLAAPCGLAQVPVSRVAVGGSHACAVTPSGAVKCWGDNALGQLGRETATLRADAGGVAGLDHGVESLSAGWAHTCAVTAQGGVKCWGRNTSGQLGDGTTTNRSAPVDVVGLSSGVASVSAGMTHTCAVTTSGALKCWGDNSSGQLGDGTMDDAPVPVQVAGLSSGIASVATSSENTCALDTGGSVRCWGYNGVREANCRTAGEICIPDWWGNVQCTPITRCDYVPVYRPYPASPVHGMEGGYASIAMLVAGNISDVCGVRREGDLQCFGVGEPPVGAQQPQSPPVAVRGLARGSGYWCALGIDRRVYCSGMNSYGQLGDGTTRYRSQPQGVDSLPENIVGIAAAVYSTCAITAGGEGYCWGSNASGQLGDGTTLGRPSPTSVAGLDAASWPGGLTGLWWNPAESGWGIGLNQQGEILFATLYSYDAGGRPMWLVMSSGTRSPGASTFSGTLYRVTGPPFDANPFTPVAPQAIRPVGTMSIGVLSPGSATLTYTVDGITVTKAIEKQVFGSRAAYCVGRIGSRSGLHNYQDLWWNPAESGWGLNIAHQDDHLFATLFTYGADGRALWLVMSGGGGQPDGSYLGDLYRTTGPPFDARPFTPITSSQVTKVGTMRLKFSDGETGTITYSVDGSTVTKRITRQLVSSPVPACS